ncbi:MAG TPA: hypothetical protein ENG50_04710 [Candidatus Altiarchaeales archaeon]|nr:hypothetical protein [Candidatus Altiarchaeales archaeon]
MKIIPVAFDSLGVRSMCTFLRTDKKILIDPGAALGPSRYGLPPHKLEIEKLYELKNEIEKYAKEAEILTISHYHYDHYSPDNPEMYKNKVLLIKHPKEKINRSQFGRASRFLEQIGNLPKKLEFADGKSFEFGKTKIKFSKPCFHGSKNSKLGYVIMCSISYKNRKILHASDVQGPILEETSREIISENPDLLIISGYPTLFLGWRFSAKDFEKSLSNLIDILEKTKVEKVILDHHLVRDLHYKEKISKVLKAAKEFGKEILTAAEYLGKEPEFLEALRKELYERY